MPPLRCVLAEWQILRVRLTRTRLPLWLILLAIVSVALQSRAGSDRLMLLALRVGMLAALLGVAFGAGGEADRAALPLILTHPTNPFALALGRWLAAVTTATGTMLVALAGGAAFGPSVPGLGLVRAAVASGAATAAAAGAALPGVWLGGNTVAAVLFLYIAGVSSFAPSDLQPALSGPLARVGSVVLAWLPGVSRYHALGSGTLLPWLHAIAWSVGGVAGAAILAGRARR